METLKYKISGRKETTYFDKYDVLWYNKGILLSGNPKLRGI